MNSLEKTLLSKKNALIVICLTTLLSFISILPNKFVIDDHVFIEQWSGIEQVDVIASFKGDVPPGHEGTYRPLRGILYSFYYQFFGTWPVGYHIHSLVVHILATSFIYLVVLEMPLFKKEKSRKRVAFFSGLLFGLHPIHTEAITYLAASMDMTGIVFGLAGFYFYQLFRKTDEKVNLVLSVLLFWISFFFYEMALPLVPLLFIYELVVLRGDDTTWKESFSKLKFQLWHWLGVIVYFGMRFTLAPQLGRGPYLADSPFLTALTMTKVLVKYGQLLLWPVKMANNHVLEPGLESFVYRGYQTETIMAQSLQDFDIQMAIFGIGLVLIAAIGLWLMGRGRAISLGIFWFFFSLLPVMEIVPLGAILNERSLYLASFGFILIIAWLLANLAKLKVGQLDFSWVALGLVFTLATAYSLRTFTRNFDWNSDKTLWQTDLSIYPNSAYAHYSLGNVFLDEGDLDSAQEQFAKALEDNPGMAIAAGSQALIYSERGEIDKAIETYERAMEINQDFYEAANNLGNLYKRQGDIEKARFWFKHALRVRPDFELARRNIEEIGYGKPDLPEGWQEFEGQEISLYYPPDWSLEFTGVQEATESADLSEVEEQTDNASPSSQISESALPGTIEIPLKLSNPDKDLSLGFFLLINEQGLEPREFASKYQTEVIASLDDGFEYTYVFFFSELGERMVVVRGKSEKIAEYNDILEQIFPTLRVHDSVRKE